MLLLHQDSYEKSRPWYFAAGFDKSTMKVRVFIQPWSEESIRGAVSIVCKVQCCILDSSEQHDHLLLLLDSTEHFVLRKKHETESDLQLF